MEMMRQGDEFAPCVATVIEGVEFEHAVRQPVVTHELPDIFLRVQLGASRRQRDERYIWRDDQPARQMPAGLIEQKNGMPARRDFGCDLGEVQIHRLGVAGWQDERCAFALLRADRAEDVGRGGTLVVRRRGTRSTPCPSPRDLVLLADARLIREPYFYIGW